MGATEMERGGDVCRGFGGRRYIGGKKWWKNLEGLGNGSIFAVRNNKKSTNN